MRLVLQMPELQLWINLDQPLRKWPGTSAGIVGNLYARSMATKLSPSKLDLERNFDERDLLSSFWGDYLTFRHNGEMLKVMRDPSGALPCFFALADDAIYLASDVSLLVLAIGRVPAIDWHQLAQLLYVDDLPEETTALAGVRELLPGHILVFAGNRVETSQIWSPWDQVAQGEGPTAKELEHCVRQCVTTVAAPFQSVLVGVSGGLDSSIVATCLKGGGPAVHAVTISTEDAQGDEAGYAQILCDHLGWPLIRQAYRLGSVDIDHSCVGHLARPGGRAQLQAYDAAVLETARRTSAQAFLSGVGGDNVFYHTSSARPLVDHFLDRGPGLHLITTLLDICRLTGCTSSQAIRQALAVPRGAEACKYRWRVDARFLHADRLAELGRTPPSHPWLIGPSTSKPGQAAHIGMILRAQHYIDAQDRELPITFLHPLMAQPIMEMCLGIPSWRAITNGRDRAVARQAFASSLPAAINERRAKGSPDGFAHQVIRANLSNIRERLLRGVLAEQQILDLSALDTALREENLATGNDFVRILLLLDTEAWVRHWIARGEAELPLTRD